MDRVDAEHLLAAVEQLGDATARGLVAELLDAVADVDGGVAHDVEPALVLEDLILCRVLAGEELELRGSLWCAAPLVLQVHLHALTRGGGELPVLLVERRSAVRNRR